jgi:hypothetical protein
MNVLVGSKLCKISAAYYLREGHLRKEVRSEMRKEEKLVLRCYVM